MYRLLGALLAACLLACGLGQAASAGALQFAYEGAGCTGRPLVAKNFEPVLGRKADGVTDFVNYLSDWPSALSSSKWGSWCWSGSDYRLAWSVPLAVKAGANADLASTAAGKNNTVFTAIAADLVVQGHADAYIRLGWEFNGRWEPWGGRTPATVAAAYRQAHDAMAAVAGAKFRFVWNPALYEQGFWPDQAYPGDAYVDVVATDAYAAAWGAKDAPTITAHAVGDATQWNVRGVVAFAKQHGKPYAFPEWGTGHNPDPSNPGAGDYPAFIKAMAPYVAGAEFAGYWDYRASDYDASFTDNPQAAAAFKAAFGPAPPAAPVATITASVTTGAGTVTIEPNADGSAWLHLSFPTAGHHYVAVSPRRQIGWDAKRVWFSGAGFDWDSEGVGKVWVGSK